MRHRFVYLAQVDVLDGLASKSQVVWAWMTALLYDLVTEADDVLPQEPPLKNGAPLKMVDGLPMHMQPPHPFPRAPPVKYARQLMPSVMEKCALGRSAHGRCLAFVNTQQPFAYVQLLGALCQLLYLVNSIFIGISLAKHTQDADGTAAYIVADILKLLIFPLFFNGLLFIAVVLENPLGKYYCDLPGRAYAHFCQNECDAFAAGTTRLLYQDAAHIV